MQRGSQTKSVRHVSCCLQPNFRRNVFNVPCGDNPMHAWVSQRPLLIPPVKARQCPPAAVPACAFDVSSESFPERLAGL
jgi:hypothetical protein